MKFSFTKEKIDNLVKTYANTKLLEYKFWLHEYAEDEVSLGYHVRTMRRLFNYLGVGNSSEITSIRGGKRSAYFDIACNYRAFDARLLQIKYNLLPRSLSTWRIKRFVFFFIRILLLLSIYLISMFAILYYWGATHFNLNEVWLLELPTWYLSGFNYATIWVILSDCFLWVIHNIMLFCQIFNDWCYAQLLQFFVLIDGRESWEVFFWGGYDKYIFREAFFNLVGDTYLNNLSFSLFTASVILVFQIYLIYFIFKFLLAVSDMWNLSINLSQPVDWDIHFLSAESINQVVDFDLKQTLLRPGVLHDFLKYYRLGYIDNELVYFNTLENLLFSSRATFLGYRGFLNLFPSKNAVFNLNRILKKKILPNWWLRVVHFSNSYLRVSPMLSELHRLSLAKDFVESGGWLGRFARTYTPFSLSTFASLKRVNVISTRFPWIIRAGFRILFGQVDTATRADTERLKDLIRPNFKVFWDLKEDDVDDVYSKWHSFEASDNVFDWYGRELEFLTTNTFLRKNFRTVQRKNFRYGLYNLVGNYAFFRKQINYNAVLVHEELDADDHPFDAEDSIEGLTFPTDNQYVVLPEGEDEVEEPDEEDPQFEEESEDFYKEFLFEDGFLHLDQESVDTFLPEDEISVDELMAEESLIDTKTIQFPEDEEVFATEEEEWREDVMDIFLTQVGRCPNFWRATPELSYWGKAELEFGTVRNYRERVFDTIYDDVSDFFWLNSDSQNVVPFATFSRGRIFTDAGVRGWRKVASLMHLYRKVMGRLTYVRPQINTNFVFLSIPFYTTALFYGIFWWSLFAYLFTILLNVLLVHFVFFDVSFVLLLLVNLSITGITLFFLSLKTFRISFLRFLLTFVKSIPIFLFNCCVLLFVSWTSAGLVVFGAPKTSSNLSLSLTNTGIPKVGYRYVDLPFVDSCSLEWGFFSRYCVNKQILPCVVFSTSSQVDYGWRMAAVRTWKLPLTSESQYSPVPQRVLSHLTSFHDLRVNSYAVLEFNAFVRESALSCVMISSYCGYSSPLLSNMHVAPSFEILNEFLWERQRRLRFYENDSQRLKYARDLERYFTLGGSGNDFSKIAKNVFSRFFFATHARKSAQFELVAATANVGEGAPQVDSLSQKMLRFSVPSKRRRATYLEPRVAEYDEGHVGVSELGRLFLSRNLLDRVYFDQVSRGSVFYSTEQLFYAQTFGFRVTPGEIKFPRWGS